MIARYSAIFEGKAGVVLRRRKQECMYGLIMNQFRQYVSNVLGSTAWEELTEAANIPTHSYFMGEVYPDEHLFKLVLATSRRTGTPLPVLLEQFGMFIAPTLLRVYRPLLQPDWRTLEVIEHTEQAIHTVIRRRDPGATPPRVACERVTPAEVLVEYRSARRLCSVAKGIMQGIATEFGDRIVITETECMHFGDQRCLMHARLES